MKQKYFHLVLGILILSLFGALFYNLSFKSYLLNEYPYIYQEYYGEDNRVIIVPIIGDLVTSQDKENPNSIKTDRDLDADKIAEFMKAKSKDEGVKGFILEIDTFGGNTVSDEIMKQTIEDIELPIISVVKDHALSNGISLSSYSDYVFISPLSDIGDIGIINMMGLDNIKGSGEVLCWVPSSKFKSVYLPQCDKSLINPLVYLNFRDNAINDVVAGEMEFIKAIAEARNLSFEEVLEVGQGKIMTGKEAVERGLADKFGNMNDALKWFEEREGKELRLEFTPIF